MVDYLKKGRFKHEYFNGRKSFEIIWNKDLI